MAKTKIVHVIDSLAQGGAETMLVDLLQELSLQYEVTLVTLTAHNDFGEDVLRYVDLISLNYSGIASIPSTTSRLRKIIREKKPDLVRCQLYWSTIIGRLATPRDIPFFFSVHATLNEDPIAFHKRYFLYLLEVITYRKRQRMIGVTNAVIDSFKKIHKTHGSVYLLHNYVRDSFFNTEYDYNYNCNRTLKLVAVCNLRLIKNVPYMVEAMKLLADKDVSLDIYGDGPLKNDLLIQIEKYNLVNVQLKGKHKNINEVLPLYDVFISASTVEGFGIAVAEAMAVGLPVIITDIPVYKELCGDKAIYIDFKDKSTLTDAVLQFIEGKVNGAELSQKNRSFAKASYTKRGYLSQLNKIYASALT